MSEILGFLAGYGNLYGINIIYLLLVGLLGGALSGFLGIGGAIFTLPILIFLGVPGTEAVPIVNIQAVAVTLTGMLSYALRRDIDYKLGVYLLFGMLWGIILGGLIKLNTNKEEAELLLEVVYILVAFLVGSFILIQFYRESNHNSQKKEEKDALDITDENPPRSMLSVYLIKSKKSANILNLVGFGMIVGVLSSLIGFGGGSILSPYLQHINIPSHLIMGVTFFLVFSGSIINSLMNLAFWSINWAVVLALIPSSIFGTYIMSGIARKIGFKATQVYLGYFMVINGFIMLVRLLLK